MAGGPPGRQQQRGGHRQQRPAGRQDLQDQQQAEGLCLRLVHRGQEVHLQEILEDDPGGQTVVRCVHREEQRLRSRRGLPAVEAAGISGQAEQLRAEAGENRSRASVMLL
ncbi:hypothetical protein F7725_008566 [Dissostichus mawsoni]|uniref:Uncharacterized protein n=1 Tax=Dissostichus mawsoni TaxID=36200 RepID=A0A7J5Y8E8_DISMA|nr:hypothetical protein F7725_008566 [Dissostichus mawsoni]